MDVKLIWVSGLTGVGKSHYVNQIPPGRNVLIVRTGEIARKFMSAKEMFLSPNPTTPLRIEEKVRDIVVEQISGVISYVANKCGRHSRLAVYVDSMPRSREQLDWIQDLPLMFAAQGAISLNIQSVIEIIYCSETLRLNRWKQRVLGSVPPLEEDERQLKLRRLNEDAQYILPVYEKLIVSRCVPVVGVDSTTYSEISRG